MLVTADTDLLDIAPGGSAEVVLDVRNTSSIIDGVTTRVIGLPASGVTSKPMLLPLFPDASGQVTLSVGVPPSYPAGRHAVTIEVASVGARLPSAYLDLDMLVAPRMELSLACRPQVARARRQARFVLQLANTGNLALDVELTAADADRAVSTSFTPARLRIEAGTVAVCVLRVRGPRMITGAELDRTVTVQAVAVPAGPVLPPAEAAPAVHYTGPDDDEDWLADLRAPAPDDPAVEPDPASALEPIARTGSVRLRQRPLLSRGLLTALVLLAIIGLWAAVFLLGLNQAFKGEPMTKQAPASFFAATGAAGQSGGIANAAAVTGDPAPAGALPKSGPLPPGVGAVITGTVMATSNHQPAGRILVEALRVTDKGLQVASSAASQTDGTYTLAGLFPTDYLLRFSATGYKTVWYPGAPNQAGARPVAADTEAATSGIDVAIPGLPASIQGTIDPGDTLAPVTATVQATSLVGKVTRPVATTVTGAGGTYRLANLPAPGTYQLSFTAPNYQATTVVTTVAGGQNRFQSTVRLSVGNGQIGGVVTDGHRPLGGVAITTTVNGKDVTIGTPTTGTVGSFVIPALPTPGTYVITFAAPGYGAQTSVVQLGPGQSRSGLNVALAAGVGSVSGVLTDSDGNGLGGASVTVGGAPTTMTTTTLTTGAVGYFSFNALPAPGSYTLTFSLPGHAAATVPVELSADGAPPRVRAVLATALGRITGVVTGPDGSPLPGASVLATDGRQSWKSQATGAGGGLSAGGFLLTDLAPGTYTVTASMPGFSQQTALLTVTAGTTVSQNLRLGPGS
ncbi:carboxypeptidase regulatory-like domain-containing protein [Jatrophihabitans sp.]|uniref:carboxypeptidase regulatory-like domain-containing protein n=1 Tax=Jatrophihabitans sp. TaxID=1932789 RepID=UPI002CEFAAA3|nr:carboxypeptidase-like regulatory domain-containing protein [Jatrophihabitans sp.]